jgi:ubiquinone/menaquinone biosynthesis C-methylase UbiE
MMRKQRLPRILPKWIKERIDVHIYKLNRFLQDAGENTPKNSIVLDAGAGEGRFKYLFSHTRYIGLDFAIGDNTWNYLDLDIIADLGNLPFSENIINIAICTQVLEHVPNPFEVISEIFRVLKPGGYFYLSVPQSWHQHQKPYDYYRYTSYGISYILEKTKFSIKKIEPMGGYFWLLSYKLQNIIYWTFSRSKIGRSWYTWPVRAMMGLFFQLIFPLILFYLDALDSNKDETLGHLCIAYKPLITN